MGRTPSRRFLASSGASWPTGSSEQPYSRALRWTAVATVPSSNLCGNQILGAPRRWEPNSLVDFHTASNAHATP